jgi:energy-coupling factor transporter transmembrane protein EcfT
LASEVAHGRNCYVTGHRPTDKAVAVLLVVAVALVLPGFFLAALAGITVVVYIGATALGVAVSLLACRAAYEGWHGKRD